MFLNIIRNIFCVPDTKFGAYNKAKQMIRNKLLDQLLDQLLQITTISFFDTPFVAFNLFYGYNLKSARIVKSSCQEF